MGNRRSTVAPSVEKVDDDGIGSEQNGSKSPPPSVTRERSDSTESSINSNTWQKISSQVMLGSKAGSAHSKSKSARITREIALLLEVAHFTPCCFPMEPLITSESMTICRNSWASLIADTGDINGNMCGLTVFYNEFYRILDIIDKGGYFEKVLRSHTGGLNSIAAKGAIIVRVITFSLSLDPGNIDIAARTLQRIGVSHRGYNIRPWMYQGFIEALLVTLRNVLGDRATSEGMAAWCNLFAVVMKHMLPEAIRGIVKPFEMDANYSGIYDKFDSDEGSLLFQRAT